MSKYKRPFSVNYRKPVVLESSDPRYKNLERYRSRLGRKVIVKELNEQKELEKIYKIPSQYWVLKSQPEVGLSEVLPYNNGSYTVGNVYVPSESVSGHSICSYDIYGKLKWSKTILRNPTDGFVNLSSWFDVDSTGNLYLAYSRTDGYTTDPNAAIPNIVVIKINSSGDKVWEKTINKPYYSVLSEGMYFSLRIKGLEVDKNDKLCILFSIYDYFNLAAMIIRFDENGNELLRKYFKDPTGGRNATEQFPNPNNQYANSFLDIIDMTFDSNNNLCFVSQLCSVPSDIYGTYYTKRFLVTKCNSSFNHVDSFILTSTTQYELTNQMGEVVNILLDSQSNYILDLRSTTSNTGEFEDIIKKTVLKINSNKTISWSKTFYDYKQNYYVLNIAIKGFDIDNNNNIYCSKTNYFSGLYGTSASSAALVKLLANGELSWVHKSSIPSYNQSDITQSIKINDKALYCSGSVSPTYGTGNYTYTFKVPNNGLYTSPESFFTIPKTTYEQDTISFIPVVDFNLLTSSVPFITPLPYTYSFYSSNNMNVVNGVGYTYTDEIHELR